MLHRRVFYLLLGSMGLLFMACQPIIRPAQDAAPAVTAAALSTSPTYGEHIDIGGRSLFLSCMGAGRMTVILEAGLGAGHESWEFVQPGVASFARVCSYDRAGVGASAATPIPRTSQDIVSDLHALLKAAGVPGPYILAGHSFGALHARLYAHTYANEVVGLVLVDPVHEDWWVRAAALLPQPTPTDSARLQNFRQFMEEDFKDPAKTGEGIDIPASTAQVRAAGSLGNLPLIIVKAGIEDVLAPGLPPDLEAQLTQLLQVELPENLLALSSLSIKLDVPDSGHNIPLIQPDSVVVALRTMMDVVGLSR
jgi:pimeloyl-ACP methyl ester carboxylesterase